MLGRVNDMILKQSSGLAQNNTQIRSEAKPAGEAHGVLLAALVMFVVGWGGLIYLIATTRPRIGGEIWLFFILLQIAVTGTAIPPVRFISGRLAQADGQQPMTGVIVRRSVWIGIIAVICAWLLIPRYLSLPVLFILVTLFFVVEVFLRNRELVNER